MFIEDTISIEELDQQLNEHGLIGNCVPHSWELYAIYADEPQKLLVTERVRTEFAHFKTTHSVIEF